MDDGAAPLARDRLVRWVHEGRELLTLLLEIVESGHRQAARAEHAEREAERLRKEATDLRHEALALREDLAEARRSPDSFEKEREELHAILEQLRKENEQLKAEKEEAVGAFAKLLDTVQSTNQIAQKLGVTRSPFARPREPNAPTPTPQE